MTQASHKKTSDLIQELDRRVQDLEKKSSKIWLSYIFTGLSLLVAGWSAWMAHKGMNIQQNAYDRAIEPNVGFVFPSGTRDTSTASTTLYNDGPNSVHNVRVYRVWLCLNLEKRQVLGRIGSMQPIEARDILGSKESIVLDSGMAPMGTEDTDVSALVKSIKDTSGVLVRAYFANFRREPDNRKFPQMTYGTTPFSRTPIPRLNKSFKAEHANTKIYSPFIDSLLDDEARRINKIQ